MMDPDLQSDPPLTIPLSKREREILTLLAQNLSDPQIAEQLVVAVTTVKWYNRQLFNKLGVDNRRQAVARATTLGLLSTNAAAAGTKPNLPTPATGFVGRGEELVEIAGLLADPACRLLTLVGPGGIGKTRLALEAARALSFPDGIYFVALQPLTSPDLIVPAITETLNIPLPRENVPLRRLLDYLHDKSCLLLLDNFEHLLDGAPLVAEILQAAPGVKLLITSRERLNLLEEWVFEVDGLTVPASDIDTDLEAYSAVQLFLQSARRVQASFMLTRVRQSAGCRWGSS